MNFSQALDILKEEVRVRRAGWNGKGMWLGYVPAGDTFLTRESRYEQADGQSFTKVEHVEIEQFIIMKTADNKYVPWMASQTDILAEDWEHV